MNEELEFRVIKKLADIFDAIGNPVRLLVLYALREQDDNTLKWQEILEDLGKSGGALKFHMDKLEALDLIDSFSGTYRITTKGIGLLYLVDLLKDRVEKMLRVELEQFDMKDIFVS